MINFKQSKFEFFDAPTLKNLASQALKVLSRFGGTVAKTSKRSLKVAPQKKLGELTPEELADFRLRQSLFKQGKLRSKPRRPRRTSEPGKPPFVTRSNSPLKLILFAYDRRTESVVVGPIGTKAGFADSLEYGGPMVATDKTRTRMEARPFMTPAFNKSLPNLAKWKAT